MRMARSGVANGVTNGVAKMFGSKGKDKGRKGLRDAGAGTGAAGSAGAAEAATAAKVDAHAEHASGAGERMPGAGAQPATSPATMHEVKATDGPRAVIEQDAPPKRSKRATADKRAAAGADESSADYAGASASEVKKKRPRLDVVEDAGRSRSDSGAFQGAALGFIEGVSRRAWAYADAYPHTVLYGFIGFVLAVLILVVGLWHTIIIAIFVGAGAALGRLRDGRGDVADVAKRFLGGK